MNLLISIGCDKYDLMPALGAAEADARAIFSRLADPNRFYDSTASRILLSPNVAQVRECFKNVFSQNPQIDIFSFFFAGHSGVKTGSFYLFLRDSDGKFSSTTALPIVDLFSILNELQPKQANIIIDACESGGSSFDLHHLIKPELVGTADSTRITFFAACSAWETAGETTTGGRLTIEVLKCLDGVNEIQTKRPCLDLIEIASAASRLVTEKFPDQKPTAWALNLHGYGDFALNPCFGKVHDAIELQPPLNTVGASGAPQVQLKSADLLLQIQSIKEGFNPKKLIAFLRTTFPRLYQDPEQTLPFLQMVVRTLASNSNTSRDSLAGCQCLAASAVLLIPTIKNDACQNHARVVFDEIIKNGSVAWNKLETDLASRRTALCDGNPHSELFTLPTRVMKILGWLGWEIVAEHLIPSLKGPEKDLRFHLASKIVSDYEQALTAVSDEQASYLYLFVKGCLLEKQTELAQKVVNAIYSSLAERKGNIINAGADAKRAFEYLKSLDPSAPQDPLWRPANPLSLLTVLLLSGEALGLGSQWSLRELDRINAGFYIPYDYLSFVEEPMSEGMNYVRRVGFDFWTTKQFAVHFGELTAKKLTSAAQSLSHEAILSMCLSSLIFPNRLPLCLEAVMPRVR